MEFKRRHIEQKILEASKFFKVVLIVGARQVGKSTLLSHLFPHAKKIVFDPVQDLFGARKDPDLFLSSFPSPLILDEVQFVPELLAALKRRVDESDTTGQYFLTGSQNFSMLRTIAESMAGRVAVISLENFSLQEALGQGDTPTWLQSYLDNPSTFFVGGSTKNPRHTLTEILWRGMFPGALPMPNAQIPLFFQSYIQTYVQKDVRLMENIQHLAEFDRFLGLIAALTAQEINLSQLGREIGISPQTARRWLDILAYTFQWAEIFPYYGNTIKRLAGKKKGIVKDSGLACYLQRIPSPEALAVSPSLGRIFETWVINHLQQQISTLGIPPHVYHWRTDGGAEVDLILEWNGKLYPIEIKCKSNVTKADLSGLTAFRKTYDQTIVMPGLIIYAGSECYKVDEHTLALPWNFVI